MISNLTVRKISKKLNKTKHKIQTNKQINKCTIEMDFSY